MSWPTRIRTLGSVGHLLLLTKCYALVPEGTINPWSMRETITTGVKTRITIRLDTPLRFSPLAPRASFPLNHFLGQNRLLHTNPFLTLTWPIHTQSSQCGLFPSRKTDTAWPLPVFVPLWPMFFSKPHHNQTRNHLTATF